MEMIMERMDESGKVVVGWRLRQGIENGIW